MYQIMAVGVGEARGERAEARDVSSAFRGSETSVGKESSGRLGEGGLTGLQAEQVGSIDDGGHDGGLMMRMRRRWTREGVSLELMGSLSSHEASERRRTG